MAVCLLSSDLIGGTLVGQLAGGLGLMARFICIYLENCLELGISYTVREPLHSPMQSNIEMRRDYPSFHMTVSWPTVASLGNLL